MSQAELIPKPPVAPTDRAPDAAPRAATAFETRRYELGEGSAVPVDADAAGHEALEKRLRKVRKKRKKLEKKPLKKRLTAELADRHELYQLSVQSPDEDVAFLRTVYEGYRGRAPRHFREDFCGTHVLARTFVETGEGCTAEGYDIDPDPVGWGLVMNARALGPAAERLHVVLGDVREPSRRRPDVRCAQNFSYWCFTERAELVGYFRAVYEDLADDGVFVCDLHGGSETQEEMEEEREIDAGFTYVWDQHSYRPIPGKAQNYIHFRFEDGTELHRAFAYAWRLWGLPEVRDCLLEAGFRTVDAYWEGTDEDGESGDGNFTKDDVGEADLSWIAYLAAVK